MWLGFAVLHGWGLEACDGMVERWRRFPCIVVWTEEFLHFFRIARIVAFLRCSNLSNGGALVCLQFWSRISVLEGH